MPTELKDINERKALLRRIIPQLRIVTDPVYGERKGGLSWREYFRSHPEEAELLGYNKKSSKGDGRKSRIWNANNVVGRYLMKTEGIKPGTDRSNGTHAPLNAYKAEINTDEAAKQVATELQEMQDEIKSYKVELKNRLDIIDQLRTELDHAKQITFDLLLQLTEAKGRYAKKG
jgi:predicted RNase H-like nuclease (RuvC/YqgF family)